MLHPKDKFKEDIIIDIKSEDQAAIDTKINLQKFSEYTVTDILAKTSSSNTIICKVTNLDKKQYFKIGLMDTSPENNIDYELYVYEYLFSKREEEPEIPKYFMDYDKEISGICTFNDFIHNINMTSELKKKFMDESIKNFKRYNINIQSKIIIIATYDNDTVDLYEYLNNFDDLFINIENERLIFIKFITIILLISNAIQILDRLKINHNDMHEKNILIKEEKTKYQINNLDKKLNILNSDIKIIIYDFDLSYVNNSKNKILDSKYLEGSAINKFLSNRNMFFLIQLLCHLYWIYNRKYDYNKLKLFIRNLLRKIIPNGDYIKYLNNTYYIDKKKAYDQNNKNVFWSASCILTDDSNIEKVLFNCDAKLNYSFNWVQQIPELLNRYILELNSEKDSEKNKLSIVKKLNEIYFQKKYLKYKYKYKYKINI